MVCTLIGVTSVVSIIRTFDDGNDRGFQNVGQQKLDAGEIPKRIYSTFTTLRKSKNDNYNFAGGSVWV
jgi:hypothetical protein